MQWNNIKKRIQNLIGNIDSQARNPRNPWITKELISKYDE